MSKNLSPMTEAQQEQIKKLFYQCKIEPPSFKFSFDDGKYFIEVEQMYDYIKFNEPYSMLSGLLEIAKILGCENGDESLRYSRDGCETCDYGSSYLVEWCFW
jgi:hypothetical protein